MRWLFSSAPDLTDGQALYAAIVAEARSLDWYQGARVPDTLDGRFAVLASLLALADLRLGQGGAAGQALAPRLAECFIADMDAQMREAGFGDPGLGKQVRMMVGSLASRVDQWRGAVEGNGDWAAAALASVYGREAPDDVALARAVGLTRDFWGRLNATDDRALGQGRIG